MPRRQAKRRQGLSIPKICHQFDTHKVPAMQITIPRIKTDKGAAFACLASPFAVLIIAFVLAVTLTAFGVPKTGTARSTIAALSYLYLTLAVMWLPAYCVALGWLWWATRAEETVFSRMYFLPLILALAIWFPALTFTDVPAAQRLRLYPGFALAAIASGYVWLGLVRLMFYVWRRK